MQPKLVVHLAKTPEFDTIYDDFEENFKRAQEEVKDDIKAVEESIIHNPNDKDLEDDDEQKEIINVLKEVSERQPEDSDLLFFYGTRSMGPVLQIREVCELPVSKVRRIGNKVGKNLGRH